VTLAAASDPEILTILLPVGLARSPGDLLHDNGSTGCIRGKEKPIIAHSPPEYTLPIAVKRLHISLEGICCHLVYDARYAPLNRSRKTAQVLFRAGSKLTGPIHS